MIRNIDDVQRIFLKYGPIPRFCIELAGDEDGEADHELLINEALKSLSPQATRWLPLVHSVEGISHRLFGIQPNERHSVGYPFPLTPYITGLIIERALAVDMGKAVPSC
jgi:hypothetical protein